MAKNDLNSESQRKTKGPKDPMLLRGLREIGAHMGVAPMTILRWHRQYDDYSLCFPIFPLSMGIGHRFKYATHVGLIFLWMKRLCEKSATYQRANLRRPRKRKMLQIAETKVINSVR